MYKWCAATVIEDMLIVKGEGLKCPRVSGSHIDLYPLNLWRRKHKLASKEEAPARSWIEATFHKRECSKFKPTAKDESKCCCGRTYMQHKFLVDTNSMPAGEIWYPSRCTVANPTDAYGTLEFQGGPHPSKAQYIRVAHDTKPDHLMQLITREWGLELPKLLISIQGGKANFELQPKLKKVLRKGLLKAARSTGAWIFTGGTNTGVTKHVGDALLLERSQRTGRVNTLGIAPWGIVENNQDLIGHNTEVPYHSISSPRKSHANFIFLARVPTCLNLIFPMSSSISSRKQKDIGLDKAVTACVKPG
ncbi:hypothetical protein HUJ04_004619 [Dendroctonus ponderosae]|nr:hypothetical protein HUJ04_004619 [Dendroctonus ponderosae]